MGERPPAIPNRERQPDARSSEQQQREDPPPKRDGASEQPRAEQDGPPADYVPV
jgi:hypothetical protein